MRASWVLRRSDSTSWDRRPSGPQPAKTACLALYELHLEAGVQKAHRRAARAAKAVAHGQSFSLCRPGGERAEHMHMLMQQTAPMQCPRYK